ncbi:hypothetical protein BT69DRAFT_1346759 [Atractiella rhizophila]|nr:hypothetical protein BT69DRAFT_1346759 [Atractiella rhizophila]
MEEFHRRVNRNARAKYAQTSSSYYMVYRLDILSAVAVFCGAAFVVLLHKSISLTFAGITMSSLSGTSRLLGTLAAMFVTLENDAVHVERVVRLHLSSSNYLQNRRSIEIWMKNSTKNGHREEKSDLKDIAQSTALLCHWR